MSAPEFNIPIELGMKRLQQDGDCLIESFMNVLMSRTAPVRSLCRIFDAWKVKWAGSFS